MTPVDPEEGFVGVQIENLEEQRPYATLRLSRNRLIVMPPNHAPLDIALLVEVVPLALRMHQLFQ